MGPQRALYYQCMDALRTGLLHFQQRREFCHWKITWNFSHQYFHCRHRMNSMWYLSEFLTSRCITYFKWRRGFLFANITSTQRSTTQGRVKENHLLCSKMHQVTITVDTALKVIVFTRAWKIMMIEPSYQAVHGNLFTDFKVVVETILRYDSISMFSCCRKYSKTCQSNVQ